MRHSLVLVLLAALGCGRTQTFSLGDPKLLLSPGAVDLGTALPVTHLTAELTLTNVGKVPVTRIHSALDADLSGRWTLESDAPASLGVGQSAILRVGYSAQLPPMTSATTLRVTSDARAVSSALTAGTDDPCTPSNCGPSLDQCQAAGRCVDGVCVRDPLTGASCDDRDLCTTSDACTAAGTCVGQAVKCESPPPTVCVSSEVLATYAPGRCRDGTCFYEPTQMQCPFGCVNNKCFDPCEGVVCNQPPTQCHQDVGTCVPQRPSGVCKYELVEQKPCDDGDSCTVSDRCAMGVCAGAPMQCLAPPAGRCVDMDNAEVYDEKGFCQAGTCQYTKHTDFCAIACLRGQCQKACDVSLAAGSGVAGFVEGTAAQARFSDPYSLVVDSSGTVFINDTANGRVRQLANGQVTTPAGATNLQGPHDVAIDGSGGLLVGAAGRVYRIFNGAQTVLAGTGVAGTAVDGPSQTAVFGSEVSIAGASGGDIFVTDAANQRIRKITNGVVTTYAGTGAIGFTDGPNLSATFQHPRDLVILGNDLIIAETLNHAVRRVTPTNTIKVAGTGQLGSINASPLASRFNIPLDVGADPEGAFYVADTGNHCIRRISPTRVTTFAGACGLPGYVEGGATTARFREPAGIAVSSTGTFYVSDTQNQRIRRIDCHP